MKRTVLGLCLVVSALALAGCECQQTEEPVAELKAPEGMAEAAEKLVALGATIVGGCCGSTAEHIGAIAARLRR